MARSQRGTQPVSEEEYTELSRRIGEHFDRVRNLLDAELDEDE